MGTLRRGLATALCTLTLAMAVVVASSAHEPADAATSCDALCSQVRAELKGFTDWLSANNAKGYIGEAGWPNDTDTAAYNALADTWYRDADAAGLWVTGWATGEWWPNTYRLGSYLNSVGGQALDTPLSPASVIEAHPSTAAYSRGVNVNGGEFGAATWSAATSTFSNANPGTYGTAWHYDNQTTFNYLAGRGIKLVRLPFRWERIQPTLGGALDTAELQRLTDAVNRANAAGIKVIPTAFNYGGYMLFDGTQGVRRTIGTAAVTDAHFGDLWARLSQALRTNTGVAGYGLMNEPASMTPAAGLTAAQTWERASQQAVTSIRAAGDTKLVLVPGYNWSGVRRWKATHPTEWITDAANNIRYEAHHYWDSNASGAYTSYANEVSKATAAGYGPTIIADPTTTTTAAPATTTTTAPVAAPTLKVNDVSVTEAQTTHSATFTVSLTAPAKTTVTVRYATANATALSGSDYSARSGSLTFSPGQVAKTVAVPLVVETRDEATEAFSMKLSSPVGATISDTVGTGTIVDNDAPPKVKINDRSVAEGTAATFTISTSAVSGLPVTVTYTSANGTGISPSDFAAKTGQVTIPAGKTSVTVAVTTVNDTVKEPSENLFLRLTAPVNGTIGDSSGTATLAASD